MENNLEKAKKELMDYLKGLENALKKEEPVHFYTIRKLYVLIEVFCTEVQLKLDEFKEEKEGTDPPSGTITSLPADNCKSLIFRFETDNQEGNRAPLITTFPIDVVDRIVCCLKTGESIDYKV